MASIQKRTSPVKFANFAEKSGKGSISNLSTKVYCDLSDESPETGAWKQVERDIYGNRVLAEILACDYVDDYCEDLRERLGTGLEITGTTYPADYQEQGRMTFPLKMVVNMACSEGFYTRQGDPEFVCGVKADGVTGEFKKMSVGKQLTAQLVTCELIQNFCPPHVLTNARLDLLDFEYYLGSRAVISCEEGFEKVSGDEEMYCGFVFNDRGSPYGLWLNPEQESVQPLICRKKENYCDPIVGRRITLQTDRLRAGSVATVSCNDGYTDDPREQLFTLVQCVQGTNGHGMWSP